MFGNVNPSPPPSPRPQTAAPPVRESGPYVDLVSPDWMAEAALAIAADLCDRAGIGPEMQRLDQAMRHQLVMSHANAIRESWRAVFANSIPAYPGRRDAVEYVPGFLEISSEPAELEQLRRLLRHTHSMLQLIAANAKDLDAPTDRLHFIRGIAHGCQHYLDAWIQPAPDGSVEERA